MSFLWQFIESGELELSKVNSEAEMVIKPSFLR